MVHEILVAQIMRNFSLAAPRNHIFLLTNGSSFPTGLASPLSAVHKALLQVLQPPPIRVSCHDADTELQQGRHGPRPRVQFIALSHGRENN